METENNKKNELREKYDALEPIAVESHSDRYVREETSFIQKLIAIAKDAFGEYKNNDSGMGDIIYNRTSVRSIKGHAHSYLDYDLLPYVPDMIMNGIFVDKIAPKGDANRYLFAAKIKVGTEIKTVGFVVREDSNGKRYYMHTPTNDLGATTETPNNRNLIGSDVQSSAPESIPNILKKYLKVNS